MKLLDKIQKAKELRFSSRSYGLMPENLRFFNKIYWAYIFQCILLGKKEFKVVLKDKSVPNEIMLNFYLETNDFIYDEYLDGTKIVYYISEV